MLFKVQDVQRQASQSPNIEQINLEMTKQTLNTMIDGFNRIKEQLNSIAMAEWTRSKSIYSRILFFFKFLFI